MCICQATRLSKAITKYLLLRIFKCIINYLLFKCIINFKVGFKPHLRAIIFQAGAVPAGQATEEHGETHLKQNK